MASADADVVLPNAGACVPAALTDVVVSTAAALPDAIPFLQRKPNRTRKRAPAAGASLEVNPHAMASAAIEAAQFDAGAHTTADLSEQDVNVYISELVQSPCKGRAVKQGKGGQVSKGDKARQGW
jgi:hypothetical protein